MDHPDFDDEKFENKMRTSADAGASSSSGPATTASNGVQRVDDKDHFSGSCPEIYTSHIEELLNYFAKNAYTSSKANEPEVVQILEICKKFLEADYDVDVIKNTNGDLCAHYPKEIYVIKNEKSKPFEVENNGNAPEDGAGCSQDNSEQIDLATACNQAKFARCRTRFPVPVIWYNGKHICRAGTLSGAYEIVGRAGLDLILGDDSNPNRLQDNPIFPQDEESSTRFNWEFFDTARGKDIKLLQKLKVDTIFDLMVEKKKIKYKLSVSSSEKVDQKNRYRDFKKVSLPYPGCEFFKKFKENNCSGENLYFDFNQEMCDTELNIPADAQIDSLGIDFSAYKDWDLNEITQNYIKYILYYLKENQKGILIHCISGWDRTPLFVSLIRILLWADNLIHTSLSVNQMLYFTIAYDWLLFGHKLSERVVNQEEIFMFCFYALKFFFSEEYSLAWDDRNFRLSFSFDTALDVSSSLESDDDSELFKSASSRSVKSKMSQSPDRDSDNLNGPFKDAQKIFKMLDSNSTDTDEISEPASPRSPRGLSSPTKYNNGSSNGLKRTPPVNVPKSRTSSEDSCASWLSASWQVVSTTGSFKDSDKNSDSRSSKSSSDTDFLIMRRQKLKALRDKFYSCYYQTAGKDTVKYV